jgi:hypothetical protein
MEFVKIGEFKVGDNLRIFYGDNNPNNRDIQIRAIVDMEVVIFIDNNQNYFIEKISYFNLLCKFGNLLRLKNVNRFETDLIQDPRI